MHMVIDLLAVLLILLFFWLGWRKGTLLSLLGIVRIVLAYAAAYFAGRYLGYWLGGTLHRPRIVMMPSTAGLTFVLVAFAFQFYMWKIRMARETKKEKDETYRLPWLSRMGGGVVNAAGGTFSLILLFWLSNLLSTGLTGHMLPGSEKSILGSVSTRAAYEAVYMSMAREGRESQAAATARVISNPEKGLKHLQNVLEAESVQQILTDRDFASDLMSGDPERIEQNPSLQKLFNDRATLEELKELGLVSRKETRSGLCEKLSRFGSNDQIRFSMEDLRIRGMLRTDKILLLIRDPEFDAIVSELVQ